MRCTRAPSAEAPHERGVLERHALLEVEEAPVLLEGGGRLRTGRAHPSVVGVLDGDTEVAPLAVGVHRFGGDHRAHRSSWCAVMPLERPKPRRAPARVGDWPGRW